jgi:undecaprenyl-diphosphatase
MKEFRTPMGRTALALFLFMAFEIFLIAFIDRPLSQYMRTLDPALIDSFRAYTNLGKSDIYLWPSGLAAIVCFTLAQWEKFPNSRRDEIRSVGRKLGFFFLCVALSGIASDIIKPILGRARPVLLDRQDLYAFTPFTFHTANYQSMPSGHATTAFAVAAALALLWPRGKIVFYAFAFAIGLSRIMVNAHFLSDVIAGAALGLLTVKALRGLFQRQGWRLGPKAPGGNAS